MYTKKNRNLEIFVFRDIFVKAFESIPLQGPLCQ